MEHLYAVENYLMQVDVATMVALQKPGRTEPGRGPDIPERGAPGAPVGRCGGRGTTPPVENGLLPGRGGRGTAPPVENGLLPGRGVAGFAGASVDECDSGVSVEVFM